jgi:hypothetical protein
MKRTILKWEVLGIIFVVMIGALFHFMFEFFNYWAPAGAFFPVNESVWEHLKLPYWPLIIFSLIEYNFLKDKTNNFVIGKTLSFLISIGTILTVFYAYTAILGAELLIIDILSFVLGVVIGQLVSYLILSKERLSVSYTNMAWILFIAFGILFAVFTYFPPYIPIFQDAETGLYGIIEHYLRF